MNRQPAVFVDAVFLIAANDPSDQWAATANQVAEAFESRALVTTDGVLSEFLAHFSRYKPNRRLQVAEFVNQLRTSRRIEVVELTNDLVNEGIAAYSGDFLYTRFSLQDCISILVMRQRGISEALTADREFTLAGINVLMQAPSTRRSSQR